MLKWDSLVCVNFYALLVCGVQPYGRPLQNTADSILDLGRAVWCARERHALLFRLTAANLGWGS